MSFSPRIDILEPNEMLNGAFDFWNRGITATYNNGQNGYVADRYQVFNGAGTTAQITYAQSSNVPTQAQSGFTSPWSLGVTVNTSASIAAGGYQLIKYAVEGNDYARLHGNAARLSFWVNCSVPGTYAVSFSQTAGGRSYVAPFTVIAASTWEKKFIDLTFDTIATGYTFDNSSSLQILWCMDAGTTNQTASTNQWINGTFYGSTGQTHWLATPGATFNIAQVSLNLNNFTAGGSSNVDIPFKRAGRTIGQEKAMCQRYYQKSMIQSVIPAQNFGVNNGAFGFTIAKSGVTQFVVTVPYSVPVRSATNAPVFYNPSAANAQARNFATGTDSTALNGNGFITNTETGFSTALAQPAGWTAGDNCAFGWSIDAEI